MKELRDKAISFLSRLSKGHVLYVALIVVGFLFITAASQNLYSLQSEDTSARSEYDSLREMFYASPGFSNIISGHPATDSPSAEGAELPGTAQRHLSNGLSRPALPNPFAGLQELNPDFAGWISIADTDIDYPIVQGSDNSYYLSTTFTGSQNPAGAIFMDYRIERGFDAPVSILYGHNMRNGSMFATLNEYIDPAFIEEHPDICIITPDGEVLVYRVFEAKRTDMWDTTYDIESMESSFAAIIEGAGNANRFLLLSTCTPNADRSERMLVYAALVD